MTMGVADTAMVSSVGEAAVSGVSLVDGINMLVISMAASLVMNVVNVAGNAILIFGFGMWVFRVALCYVFVLYFELGLMGVWYGIFADWMFRAVMFAVRFYSGKWIHKVV